MLSCRTGWRKGVPCLQALFRAGCCWEEVSDQGRWNMTMFVPCCSCAWYVWIAVVALRVQTMYCCSSTGAVTLITRMGKMWRVLESAQQRKSWIMMMTPWSWSCLQVDTGFVLQHTFSALPYLPPVPAAQTIVMPSFGKGESSFAFKCLWGYVLTFHYCHCQVVQLLQHWWICGLGQWVALPILPLPCHVTLMVYSKSFHICLSAT